jgi:hypothetical protein
VNSRGEWYPASNGTSLRRWFLYRDDVHGIRGYHWTAAGYLIRYASYETAQKAADKLNAAEATS